MNYKGYFTERDVNVKKEGEGCFLIEKVINTGD